MSQWWKKARKRWQMIEDEENVIGIFGLDPLEKAAGRIRYKHDEQQGPGWTASVRALSHDLESGESFHQEEGNLDKAFMEAVKAVQGGFAAVVGHVQQIEANQQEAEQIVTNFLDKTRTG